MIGRFGFGLALGQAVGEWAVGFAQPALFSGGGLGGWLLASVCA
jgi:hypothetical protein